MQKIALRQMSIAPQHVIRLMGICFWGICMIYPQNSVADSLKKSPIDSLFKVFKNTESDTSKVNALVELSFYETSFSKGLGYAQKALDLARKVAFKMGEASALVQLAAQHCNNGSYAVALHYAQQSIKIREEINAKSKLASSYNMIALIYRELGDGANAINYIRKALLFLPSRVDKSVKYKKAVLFGSMGRSWRMMNKSDSAWFYYQRSYELFQSSGNSYQMYLASTGLGDAQLDRNNYELAIGFYREALKNCRMYNDTSGFVDTYERIAKFYVNQNQLDSAAIYSEMAYACANATNNFNLMLSSARRAAETIGLIDSRTRANWLELAFSAMDSILDRDKTSQLKSLLLNQEQIENDKIKVQERDHAIRKTQIEYSILALFVVLFLFTIQLASRSILFNERWISFMGVLSLLLFFEFINLCLHPLIAGITKHSPFWMFAIMVFVAAILIPIHHTLEHKMVSRLTLKNRNTRIRKAKEILSNAKEVNEEELNHNNEK